MSEVTVVKTLTGHKYSVNTTDMKTIKNIKEFMQEKEGIVIDQIKFISEGKQVNDETSVESVKQKTLHMIFALRGGGKKKISKKSSKKGSKKSSKKGSKKM
jgi:hypothetical protein